MAITADDWVEACAEPAIAELLGALIRCFEGPVNVLETGGYTGFTSKRLARAVADIGGRLTVCEIDPKRAEYLEEQLAALTLSVPYTVVADDVLKYVASLPNESLDFVWVDDDHTKEHVAAEIATLLPKMRPNGILAFHDVFGSTDLQSVVRAAGGYALDLPRLGPAGGLGLLQIP